MKATNYRYLEFVLSFDDYSGGNRNLMWLRLHGIVERVQGPDKYFTIAYGKEIIAAG